MKITLPCFLAGPKIAHLKKRVGELERKVQELAQQCTQIEQKLGQTPTIEYVYVERINVDRLELSNNFGAMGVRELSGALNVGVNCLGSGSLCKQKAVSPGEKQEAGKTQQQRQTADKRRHQETVEKEDLFKKVQKGRSCRGAAGDCRNGPVLNIRYGSLNDG